MDLSPSARRTPGLHLIRVIAILSAILALVVGCGGGGGSDNRIPEPDGVRDWTVMVYMAADNDLEKYAIDDLNEMEAVGSSEDVTIVAQLDRSPGHDSSNEDWTTTRRYCIARDSNTSTITSEVISDLGELDMADPQTLADFVDWATSTYPAERYLLVLWDHGRGWQTPNLRTLSTQRVVKAIHIDDTDANEMSLSDLRLALGQTVRPDIVLFDACLMGMVEVAYSVRDCADVMVASEENLPADGQPYDRTLAKLRANPGMTTTEFSRLIVDEYADYYMRNYSGNFTMSAISLASVDMLADAVDQLGSAILAGPGTYPAAEDAQQIAQHYDLDKYYYTEYKDLYDFAALLQNSATNTQVRSAAQTVMSAVESAVLHERHSGDGVYNSHGISVYIPSPDLMLSTYRLLDFAGNTSWDEFLSNY